MNIFVSKSQKLTTIPEIRKVFGEYSQTFIWNLSLALSRHLLLRDLLPKGDAEGGRCAAEIFNRVLRAVPNLTLEMNERGWATRLHFNSEKGCYNIPLTKVMWNDIAQECLREWLTNRESLADDQEYGLNANAEKNEKGVAETPIAVENPIVAESTAEEMEAIASNDATNLDPDNDEYGDELIINEERNERKEPIPEIELETENETATRSENESEDESVAEETSEPESDEAELELVAQTPKDEDEFELEPEEEPVEKESIPELVAIGVMTDECKTVYDMKDELDALLEQGVERDSEVWLVSGEYDEETGRYQDGYRISTSSDPCWQAPGARYFNNRTLPIDQNRDVLTLGDLYSELENGESGDDEVYCFDATLSFVRFSTPRATNCVLIDSIPEDHKTRVYFKMTAIN